MRRQKRDHLMFWTRLPKMSKLVKRPNFINHVQKAFESVFHMVNRAKATFRNKKIKSLKIGSRF